MVANPGGMRLVPNIRRRRVLPAQSNKNRTDIFGVIDRHKKFSYPLEAAYKIVQNMPKEVRKDFLRACEEIKT